MLIKIIYSFSCVVLFLSSLVKKRGAIAGTPNGCLSNYLYRHLTKVHRRNKIAKKIFTKLINNSIKSGIFPTELDMNLSLKLSSDINPAVFRKLRYKQVYNFVTKFNILLVDKLTSLLDEGSIMIGIYLDLEIAFDCVHNNIIITSDHFAS